MLQARGGGQFGERVQHRAMTIANPLGLVLDDEGAAARLELRRDPRGAAVGMAAQGLDAAQRKHEPRAELHQSAPSASATAMSNELTILPEQPMRIRSLAPMPISASRTKS
jgi:hypothetical protein